MVFCHWSHLSSDQGLERPFFFWTVIRQKSLLWSSNSPSEGETHQDTAYVFSLSEFTLTIQPALPLTSPLYPVYGFLNTEEKKCPAKPQPGHISAQAFCCDCIRHRDAEILYVHVVFRTPTCLTHWIQAEPRNPLGTWSWSHHCTRSLMATKL